ncbi:SCO family protein [Verrucomicrobiota bacterium sgz303538]
MRSGYDNHRFWWNGGGRFAARACNLLVVLLVFAWCESRSSGQSLPKEELARVDFEQRLGATVPINAAFTDESGAEVRLGKFFNERPVILALVYYDCPNLCTVVLNGLLESVRDLRGDAGKEFDVVVVSIRPDDSIELAVKKKRSYVGRYGRPGSASGWHFLTGRAEPIRQLAETVGFHYAYDPQSGQFAHASGIVVLTPQGKVSRYFLGIEYPPKEVRLALIDASKNEVGSFTRRLLLLCFHYDPNTGRYTLIVRRILQAAGAGTVLALAGMIVHFGRRERRGRDGAV